MIQLDLRCPLAAEWSEQHVRIVLPGVETGRPGTLTLDGTAAPFQYTGEQTAHGASVVLRLGFAKGQARRLTFTPGGASATDLSPVAIPLDRGAAIGIDGRPLVIPPPGPSPDGLTVAGPFSSYAGFPLHGTLRCETRFESASLTRVNHGPVFTDYELIYRFAQNRAYRLSLRCYVAEPIVEIGEDLSLGMNGLMELSFNPSGAAAGGLDTIISHNGPEFEGEPQPVCEPIAKERPKDVLCRLQMPVLSEYFVPNNRGWFGFFDGRNESRGMIGVVGTHGGRWERAVDNVIRVSVDGGRATARARLESGRRFWLLHAGPVEKDFTTTRRFVYHRLQAEFHQLRLDEHLDLDGRSVWDASCWDKPGFLPESYREKARINAARLTPIRLWVQKNPPEKTPHLLHAVLDPKPEHHQATIAAMLARFEKWVRDFQSWRIGKHDYGKNVIGFSRVLRGFMINYELLRKDKALSDEQVGLFNSYLAFSARRIMDEGRWPHSKTWLHPDHPDSSRDFYSYPGEHKPDRLVWTNCLPNFQSDPITALAHLAAVIPDHPDSRRWLQFALDDLDRQLSAYAGRESGAWEESINYALYTFSYFVLTFRILKARLGIDYFQDERVRRFAGWLVRVSGPRDKRFDNTWNWPGLGNSMIPTGASHILMCYASELPVEDPMRLEIIALYRLNEPVVDLHEHYPLAFAVMGFDPDSVPRAADAALPPRVSEHMDELGVAMFHDGGKTTESYLFQKIGFWKDHYEADESSFNWYAKGTPLCMEYATYTPDAGGAAAHNLVEIPDADPLQRGYLADSVFTPMVDYTRSELPIRLKLSYGKVRFFDEVDGPPVKPMFFYIGDDTPRGPKTWHTRLLLFVKPDYLVTFDHVIGSVPHRFNLHSVTDALEQRGDVIVGRGRFDLDLHAFVQHPRAEHLSVKFGELIPGPARYGEGEKNRHRQKWFRLYNTGDDTYRTVLFAKERPRNVTFERVGEHGVRVTTPEYTDLVWISDRVVEERVGDAAFIGKTGWVRREADGSIRAAMIEGDTLAAFGRTLLGRGPWTYHSAGGGRVTIPKGPPRPVTVT